MRVSFSPQRRNGSLVVSRHGDVLTINGEQFDFSNVLPGASVMRDDLPAYFHGDIHRIGEMLHLTLVLPHGPNPSHAVAFPEPITVVGDGPIAIPHDEEATHDD